MRAPVDAVNTLYAAFNARDASALAENLAPDVTWCTLDPTLRARAIRGRDAVVAFITDLLAPLAEMRVEVVRAAQLGRHVVVTADHRGRVNADGPETSFVLHHLWRVDDGLATAFRLYLDEGRALRSARAREAAGPPSPRKDPS